LLVKRGAAQHSAALVELDLDHRMAHAECPARDFNVVDISAADARCIEGKSPDFPGLWCADLDVLYFDQAHAAWFLSPIDTRCSSIRSPRRSASVTLNEVKHLGFGHHAFP
jgi:hypothetical protein